jgi:hypothetical protein
MKATQTEIERSLQWIAETPGSLRNATRGIDDAFLQSSSAKSSWSVNDILAHLRACADIWTFSIYAMLAASEPALPDINERKWAKVTGYTDVSFSESLQAFSIQRENLLRVLNNLSLESWDKSAMIFGRKHTIFTQVRRMAKHEQEHLNQMAGLLSKIARR